MEFNSFYCVLCGIILIFALAKNVEPGQSDSNVNGFQEFPNGTLMSSILAFDEEPEYVEQLSGCGGILVGKTGRIGYQNNSNDRLCQWVVRANRKAEISVQLEKADMATFNYITVSPFNPSGIAAKKIILDTSKPGPFYIKGSIFIVQVYYLDQGLKHFTVKFTGMGYDLPNLQHLKFQHFDLTLNDSFTFKYPLPEQQLVTYEPNSYVTILIRVPQGVCSYLNVDAVDIEPNCGYDALSVYKGTDRTFEGSLCKLNKTNSDYYSGSIFFLTFITDGTEEYKGFELTCNWRAFQTEGNSVMTPSIAHNTYTELMYPFRNTQMEGTTTIKELDQIINTDCGGIMVGEAGVIRYKINEPLQADINCFWTIRVNYKTRIAVKITDGNFTALQSAALSFSVMGNNGLVGQAPYLRPGDPEVTNRTIIYKGPILFIKLHVFGQPPSKGFSLEYEGIGEDVPNTYIKYTHLHYRVEPGPNYQIFPYPVNGGLFQPYEFVTMILTGPTNKCSYYIQYVDVEADCAYDTINYHLPTSSNGGGFYLYRRYCERQKNHTYSAGAAYGILLTFQSDFSNQYKGFDIYAKCS